MSRTIVTGLIWIVLAPAVVAQQAPGDAAGSAAEQYQALSRRYQQLGKAEELAPRFLALAEKHPADPVALDALIWVLTNVRGGDGPEKAFQLLVGKHVESQHLGRLCGRLVEVPSLFAGKVLRTLVEKSPHRTVQARATFALAQHLQLLLKVGDAVKSRPSFVRRYEQYYGQEFTQHVVIQDELKVAQQIEQLYEKVVQSYGDLDEQMAEDAKTQLREVRHLAVGKPAMEIAGEDLQGVEFKLSDYRGKVVVLTFWGHW